jgi:hypothetical protein
MIMVNSIDTLMYGPFIVTAHNAQSCIEAGNRGDEIAHKVMWGINTWLSRVYTDQDTGCVCHDCPTLRRSFSKTYQPAAFLVMLPLRDEDHWGLIVAACGHCLQHHGDKLQDEMEIALQRLYPGFAVHPRTLH